MPSKLDAFADKLAQWLSDAARTSHKQRCSLKQMHADLWLMSVSTVVLLQTINTLTNGLEKIYVKIVASANSWLLADCVLRYLLISAA